jgi:hypothetical protein
VSFNALAIVTLLWGVERSMYSVEFFFNQRLRSRFFSTPTPARAIEVLRTATFHSAIMPDVQQCNTARPDWAPNMPPTYLSVQHAQIGSAGPISWPGTVAWLGLLVLGTRTIVRTRGLRPFRFVLGGTIVGQLGLHLVFGGETFLYAAHFWTLLVVLAGTSALNRFRRLALALCVVFLVSAGWSNLRQLDRAADHVSGRPVDLVNSGQRCRY